MIPHCDLCQTFSHGWKKSAIEKYGLLMGKNEDSDIPFALFLFFLVGECVLSYLSWARGNPGAHKLWNYMFLGPRNFTKTG